MRTDSVILYVEKLAKQFESVEKIVLFGSRAKKINHKTSDYDFCVWWNESKNESYGLFCEKVRDGSPTINSIDIVRFDLVGEDLRKSVMTEGIVIYEQT